MLLLTAVCENTILKSFGVLQIYVSMWSFRDYNGEPGVCSPNAGSDPEPMYTDFTGRISL